jgi:hypothetical protein
MGVLSLSSRKWMDLESGGAVLMTNALAGNPNMKSRIFAHLIFRQSPVSSQTRDFGGFTIVDNLRVFPGQSRTAL